VTVQQGPLERQVITIDLKGGMNENDSPDLSTTVTTVENLLQDQGGTWVKRPGTGLIQSSDVSGTGAYPQYPAKILPLIRGWGIIADGGKLLVKQEAVTTYRQRGGSIMDFGIKEAYTITSTGPQAQGTSESANVISVASNSTHDAALLQYSSVPLASYGTRLTICERSTGIINTYDVLKFTYTSGSAAISYFGAKLTFVADRFLQLHMQTSSGAGQFIESFQFDTTASMPASEATVPASVVLFNSGSAVIQPGLIDVTSDSTSAYVMYELSSTLAVTVMKVDTLLNVTTTGTYGVGVAYRAMCVNDATSTLWLITQNANGALVRLVGVSSSSLAVTTADYNPAVKASFICSDTVSNKLLVVRCEDATLGATTVPSVVTATIASPGAAGTYVGGAYGWRPGSLPFFSSVSSRFYMHLVKGDNGLASARAVLGEGGTSVIADLSTFTQAQQNNTGVAIPFGSFRIACALEPNFGLGRLSTVFLSAYAQPVNRYICYDGYAFSAYVPIQTFRATAATGFYRLSLWHRGSMGHCQFAGSTQLAHGGINSYDSSRLYECGIYDQPNCILSTPAGAGNLNGSYRYYAVYRHTDVNGSTAYGRVYGPIAAVNVAAGTGTNVIRITPHGITNRDYGKESAPLVEVFRTKNGGTQFYWVGTSSDAGGGPFTNVTLITKDGTTGILTLTDNVSDTNLGSNPVMYRQPGTTNAAADRYGPPGTRFCIQHKDRMFCTDAFGQRVFYSSFFVDGEQPWFNPAFAFFVHAGTGPITGLASMDGRLFVFKRDAIFAVDGDGPGEAGPTGNEFSPPQALAASYGCIDHRSIVVTPDGIMYRSARGIELLSRSLKVDWIGRNVQNTVSANPVTTGACIDADDRVHFTLAASELSSGFFGITGVEIIYDRSVNAWSVHRYTGTSGVYGAALGCIGTVQDQGTSKVVIGFGYTGVSAMDNSLRTDSLGYWVPFKIETGWIKQGPQARQRVMDVMFLGKKVSGSNHAVKISLAYDYNPTYTQTFTFEPSTTVGQLIEELNLQPQKQQVLSLRVKIEDQAPADTVTYPIGTAAGCEILSIAAEVAPKQGVPRLPSGQKA